MSYSDTEISAGNIVDQWSAEFFQYGLKNMFFSKFIGAPMKNLFWAGKTPGEVTILTNPNALIQLKMQLTKKKGDTVTFPRISPLVGHGRVAKPGTLDTGSLEDHEEGVTDYEFPVELRDWGHATRDEGPLVRQQAMWDPDRVARTALGLWFAQALDAATYCAMAGLSYTGDSATPADIGGTDLVTIAAPSRKIVGGMKAGTFTARTTDAALDDEEYMCLEMIDECVAQAESTEPIIRPIIIDGQPKYLMFLSPGQVRDLRANAGASTALIWSDTMMYAELRGNKNPLFTNAIGSYNNVLLYKYQRCQTRSNETDGDSEDLTVTGTAFDTGDILTTGVWDETDRYAHRALFCGACAAVHAWGKKPEFVAKEFDYGRQHGFAVKMLLGIGRPEFNSVDYGVCVVDTAATSPQVPQ